MDLDCSEVVLDIFDVLLGYGRFGELKQGYEVSETLEYSEIKRKRTAS